MSQQSDRPMSWEEARSRIDRGETGDKVATSDPAAAPLGSDAEAGGVPTPSEDVRRSFEEEAAADRKRGRPDLAKSAPWIVLLIALGIGVLLAIAVVVI